MRIDYNEPRQSAVSVAATGRQRTVERSKGPLLMVALISGTLMFATGFGVGWYFSQQSAKKAFRAAMEQQSLESAAKDPKKPAEQPSLQQPAAAAPTNPAQPAGQPQQAAPTGQVPLSFFESLPKGQKQTVLGSGINEKQKPAPPATPQPAQPAAAVASTAKSAAAKPAVAAKNTNTGFVVQVAAFSNQKEAEATRTKLSAKGYSASVVETNLNDKGTWYRVRIGRHLDKEAAAEIASRIGGGAKVLPDQE